MPSVSASSHRPYQWHISPDNVAHQVILVRHGRTAYNAESRIQGSVDIPLDDHGQWQVEQTGKALRSLYNDRHKNDSNYHQVVVSSDLQRAAATAHAFADPVKLSVNLDPRLRERNFGQWEGKSLSELETQFPDDFASWMAGSGGELRHGAETKKSVGERGASAINEWAHKMSPQTDLFVFAHGAWISQTLQQLLSIHDEKNDFMSLISPNNAFWSRIIPRIHADGTVQWLLAEFNRGPEIADHCDWNKENK